MGGGSWDSSTFASYAKSTGKTTARSAHDVYKATSLVNELDPKGITMRESRDSDDNPLSTPLIVALDVTGSMASVLHAMGTTGLNTLCTEVYNRKPITNPHIMCMGVGDVEAGDRAPLQVTQFEADIRIAQQLDKLYFEQGGGGNDHESYLLPWYFAAMFTSIDCFEKRGKKGYLFTIGDEQPQLKLRASDIERVMGSKPETDFAAQDLLTRVSRMYHVYHIMVEQGSHFRSYGDRVVREWSELLGQRAIRLADHSKLGEVIISTIQVNEGASVDDVVKSWDGSTSLTVAKAIKDLAPGAISSGAGVVKFD